MSSLFPHLPLVSFDSISLRIQDFSPAAARIFGRDWTRDKATRVERTAGDLLVRSKGDEGCEIALGRIREKLGYLANETEQLAWGQSVVLEYYVDQGKTGEKEELKADVLVSYEKVDGSSKETTNGQDSEGLYTIIFLRPHDADNLETDLPPTSPPVLSPLSADNPILSSSPPRLSPPPSRNSVPAVIPTSYIKQLLSVTGAETTDSKSDNGDLANSTSTGSIRSASFSSSRRSARPTIGKDREKLPISSETAFMLSHAIAKVTDDGDTSTPSGSRSRSMPASPRYKTTALRPMSPVESPPSSGVVTSPPKSNSASPLNLTLDRSTIHSASDLPPSMPVSISRGSSSYPGGFPSSNGQVENTVQSRDFVSHQENQCLDVESHHFSSDNHVPEEVLQSVHSILSHSPSSSPMLDSSNKDKFDSALESVEPSDQGSETPLSPTGAARTPLSLDELTDLVEVQPQICFIADCEGQVKWLNDAWYRYTGLDNRYHLSFEKWMSLFHPDDLPSALKIYIGAMQSGEPFKMEYRIKNKDDELRWMVCHGRAAKDADGKTLGWFCSITDVEELVQTRHEALLIQERIKAVLEGSRTFLLSVNSELNITFFEGSLDAPTSISPKAQEALFGKDLSDFLNDSELLQAARKIIDEEETEIGMLREIVGPDGRVSWARFRLVPLVGDPSIPETAPDAGAVHGVIIVGADVTEVVTTENELQKTRSEQVELESREKVAQEANRLKTEFLTTMSHELRSPIAQIMGVMELVLADDTLAEDHRRLIGKAVGSGEVLLDLIGAVLDVRKVEAGELTLETQPFLLSQVIEDARLFSVTAQAKGLHFEEDIGEFYEGTVLGDRLRLRQILTNALSNAVKFTPSGSVTFRVRQAEESETAIRLEIEVEDTGVGIEDSVLPTLFQPFRQANSGTARQFGGTGLGLVIAKKLVELMKGSVVLKSQYGKGTKFIISLSLAKAPLLDVKDFVGSKHLVPATSAAEAIKLAHTETAIAAHRERRRPEDVRVLLAEDNALIREIVTRTLRGMKFNVDAVEDGYQCLAKLETEEYDVILMDGQMPGLDGYQTSRAIRQDPKLRDVRIIALTASAIAGDRERCLEAGMSTYLAKPVRANDLQRTIFEQVELLDAEKGQTDS